MLFGCLRPANRFLLVNERKSIPHLEPDVYELGRGVLAGDARTARRRPALASLASWRIARVTASAARREDVQL